MSHLGNPAPCRRLLRERMPETARRGCAFDALGFELSPNLALCSVSLTCHSSLRLLFPHLGSWVTPTTVLECWGEFSNSVVLGRRCCLCKALKQEESDLFLHRTVTERLAAMTCKGVLLHPQNTFQDVKRSHGGASFLF